jgi:multiple sugar transport system permease protein
MTLRRKKKILTIVYHLFCLLLAFVMLYPLLWMLASSFKYEQDIFSDVKSLIPKRITIENYRVGWRGFGNIPFFTFFKNSFFISTMNTIGAVCISAAVAYGFARIHFAGRRFWFVCMLLSIMLPFQVKMIPQYILFNYFGWIDSYLPLILPRIVGVPFYIFLLVQFIRSQPVELDESAIIDGCGKIGIFFRIIFPLLKPALFTVGIFSFYSTWSAFIGPLIYLNSPEKYTVQLGLKMFTDPEGQSDWGSLFAMSSLSLVPVFILFFLFQRHISEGISTQGLKA